MARKNGATRNRSVTEEKNDGSKLLGGCVRNNRVKVPAMERFSRRALRLAVVQLLHEIGYASAFSSVLDTMADVAAKYVEEIGYTAANLARLARRTDANLLDTMVSLEELGETLITLEEYRSNSIELPFPYSLPKFPLQILPKICEPDRIASLENAALKADAERERKQQEELTRRRRAKEEQERAAAAAAAESVEEPNAMDTTADDKASKPLGSTSNEKSKTRAVVSETLAEDVEPFGPELSRSHIPAFFPQFPGHHTFVDTPDYPKREVDETTRRKLTIKQKRQVESSLVKLMRAMPRSNAEGQKSSAALGPRTQPSLGTSRERTALTGASGSNNPFTAAPVSVRKRQRD